MLQTTTLAFPVGVSQNVLIDHLKAKTQTRMIAEAPLITDTFGEVSSWLSKISTARHVPKQIQPTNETGRKITD